MNGEPGQLSVGLWALLSSFTWWQQLESLRQSKSWQIPSKKCIQINMTWSIVYDVSANDALYGYITYIIYIYIYKL